MKKCTICGTNITDSSFSIDPYGNTYCYSCCAKIDKAMLHKEATALLFFDNDKQEVTNEPKTLRFPITQMKVGVDKKNRKFIKIWFVIDSQRWWGKIKDINTNLLHCRKIRA